MKYTDLSGIWMCEIPGMKKEIRIPGTLEESGIGFPDDPRKQWKAEEVARLGFYREGDPIVTRLTRTYTFEGQARLSRRISGTRSGENRLFVEVERGRDLRLLVNGREVPPAEAPCLSAPWRFEVTGLLTGEDELVFLSDNSYPRWPREAIVYASAASDETQTNWNGLLGYVRLREEKPVFIRSLRAYPRGAVLDMEIDMDAGEGWEGTLSLQSGALSEAVSLPVRLEKGRQTLRLRGSIREDAEKWDLAEGKLHTLRVSAPGLDSREIRFGIRDFSAAEGHLTLNRRRIFLRSEANCAVFPETGYCPMDREAWREILSRYQAYGVNCMRFHSHCPPEAAFEAADEMGMLMQPELSHWDPEHAFATPEARDYYMTEMTQILRTLANHPSFVMLTFGNELQADEAGHAFMNRMLQRARETDPTRLYANGSNPHYGGLGTDPQSDFYTSAAWRGRKLRGCGAGMTGWINQERPGACHDYSGVMAEIRKESGEPVFTFEVGQYEVLPDFGETEGWTGITRPDNLLHIRKKVREQGLEADWAAMVEATGENSLQCYRAEVESALRTEGYSGISLLGLQDFPGQGTALVGMMNAHLQPKPYGFAAPERFAAFFRDVLPLALLPRYTWWAGERMEAKLRLANYGKKELTGEAAWTLRGRSFHREGRLPRRTAPAGALTDLGLLSADLEGIGEAERLELILTFGEAENRCPLWVYPRREVPCPENVFECRVWDERAERVLAAGGRVYLAPDSTKEALPHSIQGQLSPDFWSVCTFPDQEGGMGQLIDRAHPIFEHFPTERWSQWQWSPMAGQRAMILPGRVKAVIAEMDSYALLRPMAKLFECRCGGGRLLVSSLGLHQLPERPEVRALRSAIHTYLGSDRFDPEQELDPAWIGRIFEKGT